MTLREPNVHNEREPGGDADDGGLDLEQIRERVGLALRGPLRHPGLAVPVFVLVAALGLTAAAIMPRTYSAQVRLLAQRNLVVPALTSRVVPPADADNPTRNVADLIMRRGNLVALCTDLNLVSRYYSQHSRALKLKDSILGGPMTEADREYAVVATLEKRLTVQADDSSVTISVDWPDAQQAYDIIARVQQNFLEARYDNEVAMITDAIAVLQDQANKELDRLNVVLDEYQKLLADKGPHLPIGGDVPRRWQPRGGAVAVAPRPAPAPTAYAPPTPDPDLVAQLDDKRRQIRTIEDERERELANLRQQLLQAQLTLTPQHPTVIALQQQIESRSQPIPELLQLKSEERALMTRMLVASSPAPQPSPNSAPVPVSLMGAAGPLPPVPPLPAAWEADGRAQLARSKLDAAIKSYQEVMDRIDAANVELQIARTAFKYRYTVVTPAEVPKKAKKPIALMVGVGSVLGAFLLAILVAAGADSLRGRLLEPWQVRRKLKLDVLGELDP